MSFDLIMPFLKPIESLLLSPAVSEIMVNPDSSVWTEESGQKQLMKGIRFKQGALETALEVIANKSGKRLNADSPILNLRLPDGSRLAALIPPIVNPGPLLTIRKFTSRNFGVRDLIDRQMLSDVQAEQLAAAIRRGDNILIAGGTGTGKTTLLNVLADFIPDEERILIIEDTAELYIRKPHVISAEAQLDTHKGTVTFDDLLRSVLRHRPDRILVGEVRGAEARTLLDTLNTGHRGTIATIHAGGAAEALHRLAMLAIREMTGTTLVVAEAEVAQSIDVVVFVERVNGQRAVREIKTLSVPTVS